MALMATLANEASTAARPAASASKTPAVSLNRLSAAPLRLSTMIRKPMAPRTGVSASSAAANWGHCDGVVRSGSIWGASSSMASMQGPSPARRSRSSTCWASRELAPAVT